MKNMTPEQLSRLIDADLEPELIDAALSELGSNHVARESVAVYQLVGDALRGRAVEDDGYSLRIFKALADVRIDPA